MAAVQDQNGSHSDAAGGRLRARVDLLMRKGGYELEQEGLMREVSIYAERCDISEELIRLGLKELAK